MSIKLIAVDMDGTFLNGEKKYNKQRFLAQFLQLQARNIHFVAASGNQLWTLKNYFSEIQDEIAYVAENGAYVMDGVEEVSFSHFSQNVVNTMVDDLLQRYADGVILCGKQGAYIGPEVKSEAMPKLNKYFKRLQQVDDLKKVDDLICKVTINTTYYDFETLTNDLKTKSYIQSGDVKMVSSGFGFIDLIVPHKHKAYGLDFLQKKWQVQDHEILAIGDNNNDIEMVKKAGYGFAVENAIPELKQVAKYQAKHNEQEAVLDVIDIVLNATSEEELVRLCQAESL
ncbi:Cof-type HAD-IIB family hydrolase [Acinetobacter nectaris]|uniref:Cof-type HAD-IIB family hydrolase n=1 Tax=Acinetobacter nectaris TaxID=1219382 RepID=UPI001F2D1778|nr:Cof-type HAD-IIB family hydrolase [Acinetobacter nectaris]MCF9027248.1 HAD family hydrolase [Acinetobacter nectaris]